MARAFYVTTPIYYVNDEPHLGHAYTTIVADVLARYHRLAATRRASSPAPTSTATRSPQAAAAAGVSPKEYADRISGALPRHLAAARLRPDDFIRTTEERHERVVPAHPATGLRRRRHLPRRVRRPLLRRLRALLHREGTGGRQVPAAPDRAHLHQEKNYFFRMSAYQEWLIAHLERTPRSIRPEQYRHEVLGLPARAAGGPVHLAAPRRASPGASRCPSTQQLSSPTSGSTR